MDRNIQQDFPKVSENWNFLPVLTGTAFEFLEVIFFFIFLHVPVYVYVNPSKSNQIQVIHFPK